MRQPDFAARPAQITRQQNTLTLAKIAKALNIPTVLASSMEDQVQGPLLSELEEILPKEFAARIKRPGIVNAISVVRPRCSPPQRPTVSVCCTV